MVGHSGAAAHARKDAERRMSFSTRASPEGHWPCRSTAYGRSRLDRSGSEPVAPRARCLPSRPGPHFGVPATVPQRCPAREEGMMERQAAAAMSRRAACGRRWSRLGCRRWRAVRAKGQILKATRRRRWRRPMARRRNPTGGCGACIAWPAGRPMPWSSSMSIATISTGGRRSSRPGWCCRCWPSSAAGNSPRCGRSSASARRMP